MDGVFVKTHVKQKKKVRTLSCVLWSVKLNIDQYNIQLLFLMYLIIYVFNILIYVDTTALLTTTKISEKSTGGKASTPATTTTDQSSENITDQGNFHTNALDKA